MSFELRSRVSAPVFGPSRGGGIVRSSSLHHQAALILSRATAWRPRSAGARSGRVHAERASGPRPASRRGGRARLGRRAIGRRELGGGVLGHPGWDGSSGPVVHADIADIDGSGACAAIAGRAGTVRAALRVRSTLAGGPHLERSAPVAARVAVLPPNVSMSAMAAGRTVCRGPLRRPAREYPRTPCTPSEQLPKGSASVGGRRAWRSMPRPRRLARMRPADPSRPASYGRPPVSP